MGRQVVRGTPFNSYGPNGGGPNANNGFRSGGGGGGNTVQPQYREGGINTKPAARGTPEQYKHGNVDQAQRQASSSPYGKVDSNGLDMNDPKSNGSGVIFDGTTNTGDGHNPPAAATLDSPVPSNAPVFDTGFIPIDARARMGSGNEGGANESLLTGSGVMSRGMIGTSTPGGAETELMQDDVLPSVGPA